jgi:hypothetical protein
MKGTKKTLKEGMRKKFKKNSNQRKVKALDEYL